MDAFSTEEARKQLADMAKNKASDKTGLVVPLLLELIVHVFNDVLSPVPETSQTWRESKIKVLYKKCCPRQPKNYRPITSWRILYNAQ